VRTFEFHRWAPVLASAAVMFGGPCPATAQPTSAAPAGRSPVRSAPAARAASGASAAPGAPASDAAAALQERIVELESRVAAAEAAVATQLEAQKEAGGGLAELGGEVDELRANTEELSGKIASGEGSLRFMTAGTTSTTISLEDDRSLRYAALFAPHLFWAFQDRALFEAHLDLKLADGSTGVNLEFAALWFIVSDRLVVGAGKILTPFGFYNEQLHTTWVNRLPDEPLVVADHVGIAPTHVVGVSARGAMLLSGRRLVWAGYFGSGPVAETPVMTATGHDHGTGLPPSAPAEVVATGALDYDRYQRWSLGGRVGFFPMAALELGYSLHVARVDPATGAAAAALDRIVVATQGLDVNYNAVHRALRGTVDAHLEAVWASARPDREEDWPEDRQRTGLYVQVAYRPSEVAHERLARLEAVLRYDRLDGITGGQPTQRATTGLSYWIQPSLVVKAALQLVDPASGDRTRRTLFQLAGGF
jgi:hypothetical protein